MKTASYQIPGKPGKTRIFLCFPRFRIAEVVPGKTGKTSLEFSPFPRPRCADALGAMK